MQPPSPPWGVRNGSGSPRQHRSPSSDFCIVTPYHGLSARGTFYLGLTLEVKPLKLGTCWAQEELKSMGQNTACLF